MKTIVTFLFFYFLTGTIFVFAQERQIFSAELKWRGTLVTDENGTNFTVRRNALVNHPLGIRASREGRRLILADSQEILGTISSQKYREIIMHDGSVYSLIPKGTLYHRIEYESNGTVRASATYSFERKNRVIIELTSDNPDFMPFLLVSAIAHIRSINNQEAMNQLAFLSVFM